MSGRLLVIPSPPTPNGDLHLGHLSGPYLGADVFCRYQRMKGREVTYVTSADDYQSYVVRKAESMGLTPEAAADHFSDRIESTLKLAEIEVDLFTRPRSAASHHSFVSQFFRDLWEKGYLEAKKGLVLYCPSCRRYLFGIDVIGNCAHCAGPCDGAQCESCGYPSSPAQLISPRCNRCGSEPQVRSARRLFFAIGRFEAALRRYHEVRRLPSHSYALWESMAAGGLPEVGISQPGEWGILVPVPGFEDQRLSVWAEMGPGYLATTRVLAEKRGEAERWREYWCDGDAEVVQFFGFDNTFAHTILHPALLIAQGGYRPAHRFVINEFYRLEGSKFSTSRSHAIWGGDIFSAVPSDPLRYYLNLTAPETGQESFSLDDFQRTVNRDLVVGVGTVVERIYRAITSRKDVVPNSSSSKGSTSAGERFDPVLKLTQLSRAMGQALSAETFSLQTAVRTWREMVTQLNAYWLQVETSQVRHLKPNRWEEILESAFAALSIVAGCAYPVMPQFAERLWKSLGNNETIRTHRWGEPVYRPEIRLGKPNHDAWFAEVTDSQLADLRQGVTVG